MLTDRFQRAFDYACVVHAAQVRKGTQIPYVAHLMEVAAIVLMHGGAEDEAIGALLHDAAEDAGGEPRLADIRARFGAGVADIVAGCSDTFEDPKPPYRARKEKYIEHLLAPTTSASVRLVSAADKLANARAVLDDYRSVGEQVWNRFKGGREGTLWYYRSLADVFTSIMPSRLATELQRVVGELEAATGPEAGDGRR
jgi:(p)ppGpp synthase/HD superfamily hydrolase